MKESITLAGEELWLLAQKAIYWPDKRTLFIADTHFGKIGHFRKEGLAIPAEAQKNNYQRLFDLLLQVQPKALYFLGDLFHSKMNNEWLSFMETIAYFPHCEFHLISGNHDILQAANYSEAQLHCHLESIPLGPFWLSHEPEEAPAGFYNLCGHIHPGVSLKGMAKQSLRLPCFFLEERGGILPAFGDFTGLYTMKAKKGTQVFLIAEGKVINAKGLEN
ncbi:MAG: phosphoesterase [Bacteroidetes bacterium]|nr:MAG: phosphoesterase [Bacteroidota bacterium]